RAFINTWLAGVPTSMGDLNTLAGQAVTGTYNGAAFGSVFNNGASYTAGANFNGTYNFATQAGSVAITNFDGRNFSSGTGTAPLATSGNTNVYVGPLSGSGLTGQFAGSFYGPMAAN